VQPNAARMRQQPSVQIRENVLLVAAAAAAAASTWPDQQSTKTTTTTTATTTTVWLSERQSHLRSKHVD